jgi:hypothetical protein
VKTFCSECGRETYGSLRLLPSGSVTDRRWLASCSYGPECDSFTAGRRAGLKEAIGIVKGGFFIEDMIAAIRKAMKPARVK